MNSSHERSFVILGLVAAWCFYGNPAAAQTPADTASAQKNAKQGDTLSFAEVFGQLAKKYGIAFVAEDEPFTAAGISASLLSTAPVGKPASIDTVVKQVAETFDYDAERTGSLILLRKRFTDENDLPSVTLPECDFAVRDIVRVLNRLNPRVAADYPSQGKVITPLTQQFMNSLTPDQFLAMYNGTEEAMLIADGKPTRGILPDGSALTLKQPSSKGVVEVGLTFKNLTPFQQNEIRRIANYFYIQLPTVELEKSLPALQDLNTPEPPVFRFVTRTYKGTLWRLFGYEEKTVGKTKFHPLLFKRITENQIESFSATKAEDYEVVGEQISSGHTISGPTPNVDSIHWYAEGAQPVSRTERVYTQRPNISQTIAQILSAQNARTNPADTKLAADNSLLQKRVSLIGAESLSGSAVLQAISRLYNLRTEQGADKTIRLTRLRVSALADASAVPATLERLLPGSLLRAAQSDKARSAKPKYESAGVPNGYYQTNTLRFAAAQHLNAVALEKARNSQDGTLHIADLGEEGQRDLAILCVQGLEPIRKRIAEPVPDYIVNLQNQKFAGGLSLDKENKIRFALFFSTGPGVGNVPYNW